MLSRYRQQHQAIPLALSRSALFSDYTFAKDSLFAHLNLSGDELTVYEKLHTALAEKIPTPDLVVYLRADLDTLMARIAQRDRPYERGMDQSYIDSLRLAYDGFFAAFTAAPVLTLDFNHLDIVRDPGAFAIVRDRIITTIASLANISPLAAVQQPPLPQFPLTLSDAERLALGGKQEAATSLTSASVNHAFLALVARMGGLSQALTARALQDELRRELAGCMDDLRQLAASAGITLDAER